MDERVLDKLKILAESAKYDVSCASSGTSRSHKKGQIGSAEGWGICHSFAEDGRVFYSYIERDFQGIFQCVS